MKNPRMLDPVVSALSKLGFKKRAGEIFTIEATEDVIGSVWLNKATQHHAPGVVEVNPVVGVRHQEVERMVAELRGEKFHSYLPTTISSPIGYLMPEGRYRAWMFGPGQPAGAADDLASAVAAHGVPFIRRMTALAALCEAIDNELGIEDQLMYRRPVAWRIAGDTDRARRTLEHTLATVGDRSDPAAMEYRRFAAALRPLL